MSTFSAHASPWPRPGLALASPWPRPTPRPGLATPVTPPVAARPASRTVRLRGDPAPFASMTTRIHNDLAASDGRRLHACSLWYSVKPSRLPVRGDPPEILEIAS